MRYFRFHRTDIAILILAFASSAHAGRMLDTAAPTTRLTAPPATQEIDALPLPEADMAESEDDDRADDGDLVSEVADDSEAEIESSSLPTAPPKRWQWRQAFRIGMSHDDNIYLSSRQKVADVIVEAGASFSLTWGDYLKREENFLSIQYAPSYILFADHDDQNGFTQDGSLTGQWRLAKLTLGAQAGIQTLIGGDADVGARADRTLYEIALTSKYDYSEKTSLEMNFSQSTADYRTYLDSVECVNRNWIDYQLFPKTRVGAGLTFGYLQPQDDDAQTYQQALLRVSNPITSKLNFTISGGAEFRQLGSGETQSSPVFTIGANYRPFDGTEISLESSRRIHSSASQTGQNYASTGISASVRQRFLRRFFANFAGGYEAAAYEATDSGSDTSREDKFLFGRASVSFVFTKRMNIDLYYQYRRNTSTNETSSFDSNIVGIQTTIDF